MRWQHVVHFSADSTDNFRCRQLCSLLQQLFNWFLKGIQTALANRNPSLAGEFITALSSYAHNNFVGYCIYFDRLECPGKLKLFYSACRLSKMCCVPELYEQSSIEAQAMMRDITTMTWLPEMYRTDFRRSVERIEKWVAGAHPFVINHSFMSVFQDWFADSKRLGPETAKRQGAELSSHRHSDVRQHQNVGKSSESRASLQATSANWGEQTFHQISLAKFWLKFSFDFSWRRGLLCSGISSALRSYFSWRTPVTFKTPVSPPSRIWRWFLV